MPASSSSSSSDYSSGSEGEEEQMLINQQQQQQQLNNINDSSNSSSSDEEEEEKQQQQQQQKQKKQKKKNNNNKKKNAASEDSKKKQSNRYEYLDELFSQMFNKFGEASLTNSSTTATTTTAHNHTMIPTIHWSDSEEDADPLTQILNNEKQKLAASSVETQIMNNICQQMSNMFHRELRKLIPIEIPEVSEDYYSIHNRSNESSTNNGSSPLELTTSLFNEGYLIFSQHDAKKNTVTQLVQLNEALIKANNVNPILSNASEFVDKEGALNNIEKRMIAPRQAIVRFGHEEEHSKLNEKKLKQEEIEYESKYELKEFHSERTKKSKKKTAGKGWFDMEAPELTEELKQELIALRLKHATQGSANQKTRDNRLPSKESLNELPRFFQIGTIQEAATEFYSDRVRKRDRQQSFLDELLHEEDQSGYVNQRYAELQNNMTHVQKNKKKRLVKKFNKRARTK